MQRRWPLFPVTVVGSWPRSSALLEAMRRSSSDRNDLADAATADAVRAQVAAGVDIVSDGEQRRDNFYSFICDKLSGLRLMTMSELLDHVEDKAAFEGLLNSLDVPAFAIKNPTVVATMRRDRPLASDDLAYLRTLTDLPAKVTLPGPYLLSRSIWVKSLSEAAYPTREKLCDDIVAILRAELSDLAAAGCEIVQFDEPVLSEVVLAGKSATRTFMCAALAAKADPEEELELAVDLVNRVVAGFEHLHTALHVCRGNWSKDDTVLLAGSYAPLLPHLARMNVDQLVLEYATPRAGDPALLKDLPERFALGFGTVNPRTDELESVDWIVDRVRNLALARGPEGIFLNPDCGFGTFADRPVATAEVAAAKLATLAAAAARLRAEFGD